jgi:hypothetical protein
VSPETATTLAILGTCAVVMWLLSMSGYVGAGPHRLAQQPAAARSVVVAVPMPKPGS